MRPGCAPPRRLVFPGSVLAPVLVLTLAGGRPSLAQEPCFPTETAPPWTAVDVGSVRAGASRARSIPGLPFGERYELCSASAGPGKTEDGARFLYQGARSNLELSVQLDDLAGPGLAGAMIRVDPRLESSAFVLIAAERSAAGGLVLRTLLRKNTGDETVDSGAKLVPVQLPIHLRVGRIGTRFITAFSSDGVKFSEHSSFDVDGSDLAFLFQRAGMMQASSSEREASTAIFSSPRLSQEESGFPPALLAVDPQSSPLDGGVEVVITGERLERTKEVLLAGVPASIVEAAADHVVVMSGPSKLAGPGDVRVLTDEGSQILGDAFSYFGHSFVRGDFNGSNKVDLSDAIAELNYFFRGGPAPLCPQVGDVNGDGRGDVSDPVFLIGYLFLGTSAPPAPFPRPGIPTEPSIPCGLTAPMILDISADSAAEGDLLKITGDGFSPNPEENAVFFGPFPAEVLRSTETELLVRLADIPFEIEASPHIYVGPADLVAPLFNCRATRCRPVLTIPFPLDSVFRPIKLLGPPDRRLVARSTFLPAQGAFELPVPRNLLGNGGTQEIHMGLLLPAVTNLSRGARFGKLELAPLAPEVAYEEWLDDLAGRLQEALTGGGKRIPGSKPLDLQVEADGAGERIFVRLHPALLTKVGLARLDDSVIGILTRPPVGRCGPEALHPVTDRRAFGWCRLAELLEPCNGLPAWEYFIPKNRALQVSEDIFPLPFPGQLSTSEKSILYNKPAYCFVRDEQLWNSCHLADLESKGRKQIPHFPRAAIVIKTSWRTAAQLPASPDPDTTYYSYLSGGQRRYLVAFHFTTKDVDNWFWADFYVPASAGGLGGCGGSNSDRPASITGVWANYFMCTNLEPTEEICGNSVFPECGVSTCTACHKHTPDGSGPFGSGAAFGNMGLDFLFSLQDGAQSPPGCP